MPVSSCIVLDVEQHVEQQNMRMDNLEEGRIVSCRYFIILLNIFATFNFI